MTTESDNSAQAPAAATPFARHADDWWDSGGALRTLHVINPVRLEYIDARCQLAGKQVLDMGCGGGLLCEAMAARGAHVTGVDVADELIAVARDHARQQSLAIDYIHGSSADLLADGEARFDVITCLEMLEHVETPGQIIADCARLLKPGGDLVLSTLNRSAAAYAFAIIGAEYVTGLLPRGTHDYSYFIRPSELAAGCRQQQLQVCDISGLTYLPGLNRAYIGRSTAINYLLHARREH